MTVTPAHRKPRMTGAERREQILDVTSDLVGDRGFHALSIEAVAREAGITRPVIYGHFDDLDGLLTALIDRESVRALTSSREVLPRVDGAATAASTCSSPGWPATSTSVAARPGHLAAPAHAGRGHPGGAAGPDPRGPRHGRLADLGRDPGPASGPATTCPTPS